MIDDGTGLFTIGELARATGLTVRTIRYWSDEGVLHLVTRSLGGYRLYDAQSVARPNWGWACTTYGRWSAGRRTWRRSRPRMSRSGPGCGRWWSSTPGAVKVGFHDRANRYRRLIALVNGRDPKALPAEEVARVVAALRARTAG